MTNLLKTIPTLLIVVFFVYWLGFDDEVSENQPLKLEVIEGKYEFTILGQHSKKDVNNFLDKYASGENSTLVRLYASVVRQFHCKQMAAEKCGKILFFGMKESYSIFINLPIEEKKKISVSENIQLLKQRFNRLFQALLPFKISNYSPRFSFPDKPDNSDIRINIKQASENLSNNRNISKDCVIDLNVQDNILVNAEFFISTSDLLQPNFSACEAKLILIFFDVQGGNLGLADFNAIERHISTSVMLEYYRWFFNFNKYPKNEQEISKIATEFVDFIKLNFK